jgi:hypothetical protein
VPVVIRKRGGHDLFFSVIAENIQRQREVAIGNPLKIGLREEAAKNRMFLRDRGKSRYTVVIRST